MKKLRLSKKVIANISNIDLQKIKGGIEEKSTVNNTCTSTNPCATDIVGCPSTQKCGVL